MDQPKGIEGDYLETKEDNLIFDVKGLFHPKDRKVCFIRFYPHPNGDRIRDGVKFKKIYELKSRYSFLKENYPKYLFFSEELDMELQGVKNEDIKKIFTPREYFKELSNKSNLSRIEKSSKELCDLFVSKGGISENSIGITGSPMVRLNNYGSDIDLVIYGTETCLNFQDNMKDILSAGGYCRRYNLQEFQVHYEWRVGGSAIPFDEFIKCEQKKLHQGMYKGSDFFIRYIKSPEDWLGQFSDYKYTNYGRIKLKAEVTDATDSIFTPCSYKINVKKVLNSTFPLNQINQNDIKEVNSFRGRFCEHALKGEIVFIEGKLEKVDFQGNKEYFRVLLNDQVQDMMKSL